MKSLSAIPGSLSLGKHTRRDLNSRSRLVVGLTCFAALAGQFASLAAKPPPPSETYDPTLAGEIRGVLTDYGPYTQEGWDVYIPGRSFFVRTGPDGAFAMNYVPAGTYNLVISREAVKVREISGVVVTSRKLSNLGNIEVFLDVDDDGYHADVDCNDNDPTVYPGAAEVCDGKDNNCNGELDEGVQTAFYPDMDGDGYGATAQRVMACSPPDERWILTAGDCNDGDPWTHPGADEICDQKDNDCDGQIDEWCTVMLRNDSYEAGGMANCIGEWFEGEAAAATLGPTGPSAATLQGVDIFLGPDGQAGWFTVLVYQDTGTTELGPVLCSGLFETTGSDTLVTRVHLSPGVTLAAGSSIRVAVSPSPSGGLCVKHDTNGPTEGRNWAYTSSVWTAFSSGDWVIRAILSYD